MGNRIDIAILGFLVFFVLFTLTFVNPFQLQYQNHPKTRQITRNPGDEMESQWSPDGRHILFDSKRSGNSDIWIKSSKGEQPIHVTLDPADDVRPSWSNDGSKIAFGSSRSGNMDIWIKDIDGFWSES